MKLLLGLFLFILSQMTMANSSVLLIRGSVPDLTRVSPVRDKNGIQMKLITNSNQKDRDPKLYINQKNSYKIVNVIQR